MLDTWTDEGKMKLNHLSFPLAGQIMDKSWTDGQNKKLRLWTDAGHMDRWDKMSLGHMAGTYDGQMLGQMDR